MYENFWSASSWSSLTQRRFGQRMSDYRPTASGPDRFALPDRPHRLAEFTGRLQRLFAARRSERTFGAGALSDKQLGALLAPLASVDGRRSYPSAGGLYPVRCYPILLDVRHDLSGQVTRYVPELHAVQRVRECPPWSELGPILGADDSLPQAVLAFVLTDEDMLEKYGERGGRFGLVEAGAAAQSVALRLAELRLAGYLLGGAADAELLEVLGLTGTGARMAAVMACGLRG